MFTGIVEELGRVEDVTHDNDAARLTISAAAVVEDAHVGDSISVDGCCVTVTHVSRDAFSVDLMAETLRVTTLGSLVAGDRVNLERALRLDGRLGGHIVQGHVDGVGTVRAVQDRPGTRDLFIAVPEEVRRTLVPKGSITIAGVSLTVVDVADDQVHVGIIPHTAAVTTLGTLASGDQVNVEADVIGKHVAALFAAGQQSPYRALAVAADAQDNAEQSQ